jgi:protein-S-isoprenylcysteine O-methyltransferase Ste14
MAGTTQLTSLRAYLASFSLVLLVTMLAVDPQLARERSQPGPDSSTSHLRAVSGVFFLLTLISASFLVGRTHTLVAPTAFRWIALAIFTCSSSLQTWAMIANPFFSPVVRIQADRGHKLIDSGPYRLMRHPGYFAMCISVPAAAAFIVVIFERAKFEERFLNSNLPGYAQYAKTVPSGLFCFRRT